MRLRLGKTKNLLRASIDSALLAVEVYNKPRTSFRAQAYITLMIIAWTKLLHACFNHTIGNKYFYKKKNGRYEIVEGERKAWDLKTCIKQYGKLSESGKANLEFFLKLRNKIEHRMISRKEIDLKIFGECQSLLFNYENELIKLFGKEYAINENLVFSLQFSAIRGEEQKISDKMILSADMVRLNEFIDKYRSSLRDSVFNSQEYSVKLIQIPKVAGASRHDLAVQFIKWDELSKEEKKTVSSLTTVIKEKKIIKSIRYHDCYKPSQVVKEIRKRAMSDFTIGDHRILYLIFGIRPLNKKTEDPFDTNDKYCLYDELHNDYVYTIEWVEFLEKLIMKHKWWREGWRGKKRRGEKPRIEDYE
jgi:hypothetical protein